MKAAFSHEMKNIDRRATEEAGLPSAVLMENAGGAVARRAMEILGGAPGRKICVFAGRGNNGGDAFAAARYLLNAGARVRVFLIDAAENLTANARIFFGVLQNMRAAIVCLGKDDLAWDKASVHLAFADLIVDGIFGSGFHGVLSEEYKRAAELINSSGRPILAIDLPSGVEADSGRAAENAVWATHTVAFSLPKPGLFLFPGKSCAGVVSVAPIGIPYNIIASEPVRQSIITPELVAARLPARSPLAHKHQARVGVIAGARGTSGAAALCAEAALRAGAGVVRLFTADDAAKILSAKLTEVIVDALPSGETEGLDCGGFELLLEKIAAFPVLAVGPGLGTKPGTADVVCRLALETDKQLVMDADALNILAKNRQILPKIKNPPILTPHLGEMARLADMAAAEIKEVGLLETARRFAIEWGAVLVLKGAPTLVALPDGDVFINTVGNPGLATAGSGDVLTGVIAGLAAQGMDSPSAAVCGVYLHSLAADLIAQEGMVGLAAGDVIAALPKARLQLTPMRDN
ncbi:MAG: NAD(P)H-hydrate dehydratase [Acidaminococcales bacterium]|jgi:NAD(P)H-hydrate epimerase|nr:NAD(P)H-hydrate dehydratase [Acidaminococcales bacterium]